jgi:hypothetical protein
LRHNSGGGSLGGARPLDAGGMSVANGRDYMTGIAAEGEPAPTPPRQASVTETSAGYVRENWIWLVVVGGVIGIAMALRFWDLGRQSLWFDELFTLRLSSAGPLGAMRLTAQDTNPPLYYLLQALVLPLFGRDEVGLRLLPAIFGVLTTGVTYLAGRKLFDRLTGAIAAGMFAVSWMAVWYAQEARMYSMLMFFAALVLWLFALLVEDPTLPRAVGLGLALAGLAYTHVYGYLAMPMLLLPALLVPRIRKRIGPHIAVTYIIAVILFVPWALVIPTQIQLVKSQAASGSWWIQPPKEVGNALVHDLGVLSPGNNDLPGAIFFALLVAGFAVRPRRTTDQLATDAAPAPAEITESDKLWILLTLALGPIIVGLILSKYVTPISAPRNELVCLPAAYILATRGGLRLWKPVGYLGLGLTLLYALVQVPGYYQGTTKGNMRQAIDLATASPSTAVLTPDWTSTFKLQMYANALGRDAALHAVWVRSADQDDPPTWASPTSMDATSASAFALKYDRLLVVSPDASSSVADMVSQLPGYKLLDTPDYQDPHVRMWQKIK